MDSDIEDRLHALEDAHRALAAQHTAVIEVFKLIAPDISMNRCHLAAKLTILYDTNAELMQANGMDDTYQADVLHWIDVLSTRVLEGKHDAHPNRGE